MLSRLREPFFTFQSLFSRRCVMKCFSHIVAVLLIVTMAFGTSSVATASTLYWNSNSHSNWSWMGNGGGNAQWATSSGGAIGTEKELAMRLDIRRFFDQFFRYS